MTQPRRICAALALVLSLVFTPTAFANDDPPTATSSAPQGAQPGTATEFTIAPYMLFSTMSGTTTIRGLPLDVDLGPGEIFENLEFGIMGYFEVRRGRWGFAFDGLYMDLQKDATFEGPIGTAGATVGMRQGMFELSGIYRAADWAEVVFGARINSLEGQYEAIRLPLRGEASHTWVDPFVGARLFVPDIGNWRVGARIDFGGFGIGSSYAIQLYPTVGYDFAHWFTLAGGFRFLKMKYETGEGRDLFVYDMSVYGPLAGLVFRF